MIQQFIAMPGWNNKRVDALIEELEVEFDPERRLQLIHAILYEYSSEVPVIPLYYRSEVSVTPANLSGYKLPGHQVAATNHVERWTLQAPASSGDQPEAAVAGGTP